MNAYKMSGAEVVSALGASKDRGLSEKGVSESVKRFGVNSIAPKKNKSILRRITDGLTEPMMIILFVALIITLVVNIVKTIRGEGFDFVECAGILVAISLSVAITIIMEGRSARAFEALKSIGGNVSVKVLRNGVLRVIPQSELVVGDTVLFGVGDKIPVDCRIIESSSLEVDESPLTGESVPVKKDAEFVFSGDKLPLAERRNMLYGGCFISGGDCRAVVTAIGDMTEIGGIAKELSDGEVQLTPLQQKLEKLGKRIAVIGGAAAILVFAVRFITLLLSGGFNFSDVQDIFITSIILIVASVPEGLPTIVAVSLALNVIKMAKQNALVKKMVACETVGSISVICSDKTGTLTENKMTVSQICTQSAVFTPQNIKNPHILKNICVNSTANINLNADGAYEFIGSPTECAMLVAYSKSATDTSYKEVRKGARILHVYPFTSTNKRMTTVVDEGGQCVVYVKGAPEILLDMCEMSSSDKKRILKNIGDFQADAKRVIALCHSSGGAAAHKNFDADRKSIECGLIFDGFAVISDPVRKDVAAAVEACRNAGVKIKMLTGDNIVTARAIASELKIINEPSQVYHADSIDEMTDGELIKCLPNIKVVARSTPQTKLRIVKLLKQSGEVVAVTGDGINDAPAIKHADVGIAMGIAGTEVSKEASDIVLLDDSFSTIVESVRWGRGIYENFQRFIMFQLTVNLSAVLVTIICTFLGTEAPFNALQLLWLNLIMDGPPALTLGLEPIYDDLMKRIPIERDMGIVTKRMMFRICINGVFIMVLIVAQILFNFMRVWVEKEKTIIFTLFVVFQLFNAFNARELKEESIFTSFFKNKLMLLVMSVTFVLQILITQFGGRIFNTVPLAAADWLKIIVTGFSVVAFNEIYKLLLKLIKPFVRGARREINKKYKDPVKTGSI